MTRSDAEKSSKRFVEILSSFDENELKKYVFENGKEGKPYSPISFEDNTNGGDYNEGS